MSNSKGPLIVLALALLLGAGAFLFFRTPDERTVEPIPPPPVAIADAGAAPVPDPAVPAAPPVDADERLRALARSGSPKLKGWLEAPGILKRIAAAVRLVAQGQSPKPVIGFIELEEYFSVVEKGERTFIAPGAYARYDMFTDALVSLDPNAAAEAYRELRPFFDAAYAEVAKPGERFDDVLAAAVRRVLAVPVLEGPVELVPEGAIYHYADPALEARPAAEKQLLRAGPTNVKVAQDWLRRFAVRSGLALE